MGRGGEGRGGGAEEDRRGSSAGGGEEDGRGPRVSYSLDRGLILLLSKSSFVLEQLYRVTDPRRDAVAGEQKELVGQSDKEQLGRRV